jgi:hypothetical protein
VIVCRHSILSGQSRREFISKQSLKADSEALLGCKEDAGGKNDYSIHWEDKDYGFSPTDLTNAAQALLLLKLGNGNGYLENLHTRKTVVADIHANKRDYPAETIAPRSPDRLVLFPDFGLREARYTQPYDGSSCD